MPPKSLLECKGVSQSAGCQEVLFKELFWTCKRCLHRMLSGKLSVIILDVHKTLEETMTQRNQNRFYGFLCAYFTSMYGHSPGLYRNMMVKEVEEVQRGLSGTFYNRTPERGPVGPVWDLSDQRGKRKTNANQDPDVPDRRGVLLVFRLPEINALPPRGKKAQYFFFNSTNTEIKNLPVYLREAWKEMGLPGSPTFTDLRTSIFSHVKNVLPNADGETLADFVRHDSRMEAKRYAVNPSKAGETSAFRETPLKGRRYRTAGAAENQPSTSRKQKTRERKSPSGAPPLKRPRCSTRSLARPPGRSSRNGQTLGK
ncbi:uncharacterized protein LOC135566248 [Oncorhynchus nerka]|uniref:uncharacterized protein LOC135566248 n=1 Tax=Oncorhynchus nerka TaxID=8023 RepID=UPI0031B81C2F